MQNRTKLFLLVCILIGLGAASGVWYFATDLPAPVRNQLMKGRDVMVTEDNLTRPDFPLTCQVTSDDMTGTVHLLNGRVRGTALEGLFNPTMDDEIHSTEMIVADGNVWIWDASVNKGYTLPVPEGEDLLSNLRTEATACIVGTFDDTVFIVPDEVTFTDLQTALQNQMKKEQREGH